MGTAGITMLILGLPCLFFGFWLQKAKSVEVRASKKSKRKKKIEAPKGSAAKSFIVGGGIFTVIGLFALARHFFNF